MEFLESRETVLSPLRDNFIREELKQSLAHMHDIRFFADRLPSSEIWRLFDSFRQKAVYLDIETSGGLGGHDGITVIGIYDGHRAWSFVDGINLHDFEIAIAPYELIVTFNGGCFDLPVIERFFPNITLPAVHIDLRFLLRKLGYKGGLKGIEKQSGITRSSEIEGMDGFDAVRLWNAYQWGDRAALDRLIQYNAADTLHLEPLMEKAFEEMQHRLLAG